MWREYSYLNIAIVCTALFFLNVGISQQAASAPHCPCKTANLCKPIASPASKEVYGFSLSTSKDVYMKYDWSKLTTLAMWNFTDELMCFAHSKGVRLDLVVSDIPKDKITSVEWRKQFVQSNVNKIKSQFLDGLNYDFEGEIELDSAERQALVDLVKETKAALVKVLPNSKVSFDAAWASFCVDGRCFDYKGLADAADWLFVMAYDVQSQLWGPDCTGRPNSPFDRVVDGVRGYMALGIPPSKIVLGLPWYGYDFACVSLSSDDVCEIERKSFRGAPSSNQAGGTQRQLDEILILKENSLPGRTWNLDGQSPQFNYKNATGHMRQVHYDNPQSLLLKYRWAVGADLHGVGFWNIGFMTDMNTTEKQALRKEMWDLIPSSSSWSTYLDDYE